MISRISKTPNHVAKLVAQIFQSSTTFPVGKITSLMRPRVRVPCTRGSPIEEMLLKATVVLQKEKFHSIICRADMKSILLILKYKNSLKKFIKANKAGSYL